MTAPATASVGEVLDQLPAMLLEQGIWAEGHAIQTCGPTTGHFVRAIAYCETPETAEFLAACFHSAATSARAEVL